MAGTWTKCEVGRRWSGTRWGLAVAAALILAACGGNDSGAGTANPSTRPVDPAPTASAPARPTTPVPAAAVTVTTLDLADPARTTLGRDGTTPGRSLPTRVWAAPSDHDRPLIVLAHGLGGDPADFDQLATSWARAGYVVAAPQFPASSEAGGTQVPDFVSQPGDVHFVIDQVAARPELHADTDRVGVAGLSLGGSTIYGLTADTCCTDPRIKAGAVLDGLAPAGFEHPAPNTVPVLVLHCDHDPTLPYAAHARAGFGRLVAPAWLVTMPCAEHSQPYEDTPSTFDGLVEELTLDLWAGALDGDPEALAAIPAAVEADGRATIEAKG